MSRAEEAALKAYPHYAEASPELKYRRENYRIIYERGYERAEKDIIAIIESSISEIVGDAQPRPALRAELYDLIAKILDTKTKEDKK